MGLADRILSAPAKRISGKPCSVGDLLNRLPDPESAALQQMLDAGWSQNQIYDALTDEGLEVGRQTINRHRAKSCRCYL